MPRIAMKRFRDEVLALYAPPARARNSWFKARQSLDILEAVGVKYTSDMTPGMVSKFIASNPKWSPQTIKGLLGYLSPICGYAKTMGYLRVNPFDVRKNWYQAPALVEEDEEEEEDPDFDWLAEGQPEHISIDELGRLLDYLETDTTSWKGGRLYAMTATFAYTGLRRMEGLTRSATDFNLDRRIVRVKARRRRLKTKASDQPVGLPLELIPILEAWLPRAGSKWAFPGVQGKSPWTGGAQGKRPLDELKAAGKAVGINNLNFQILRHSWATHAELRGIGELMVQRQLRHTSKRTQLHYRHADVTNLARAVEGFSLRSVKA
jgi:integrase